jgi:hypothetical protein
MPVRSEDFELPPDLRSVERNDCSAPCLIHAVVAWMCPPEGWKCLQSWLSKMRT